MSTLSVRLPDEISKKLEAISQKTKRSKSSFILEVVEEVIEDYEDAHEALERLNRKNAKYLTTGEVEKELGL
ncbi:MAG: ribbon-helix-helix protein, CopG family [Candidatus Aminicenantes bacterium]|nr:ribbon-helix-helix protein, CopG family [Candidatus Aminicenantes bacterium]